MLALLPVLMAPVFGLIGVILGAWLTGRHQRDERRLAVVRERLEKFYSPMVALRARIKAKSETRVKVHSAADAQWRYEVERRSGPELVNELRQFEEGSPEYDQLVEDDNRRFREELLPLYRTMLECFTKHMWLAEPATRAEYPVLVEYIDIWERALAGLPKGVARRLDHREERLHPLYADLEKQFEHLRDMLKT
jgi:hypothetical protein